jgi:glutaredoxin
MKQQCSMTFIYLSWAILVAGLVFFALKGDYAFVGLWLVVAPLALWAYIRFFPAISRYIGYGRVDDQSPQAVSQVHAKVTLYTALGCPFCPMVKRRLLALQTEMGFNLEEVDVTLKPDLLIAKGIHAVPVMEVGEQRLVGNATSEQLANLIRNGSGVLSD